MAVTFEVIHKDIAGRVGKLKAGDKMMKTPGLLPVVNPHLQIIPPAEMKKMGMEFNLECPVQSVESSPVGAKVVCKNKAGETVSFDRVDFRDALQTEYNLINGITPETVRNAVHEVLEITRAVEAASPAALDEDERAVYFKQVQYGKYVRMALILTLLELA